MKANIIFLSLLTLVPSAASADIPFDPCNSQESKFASTTDAARGQMHVIQAKYQGWYDNPDTLSSEMYNNYRDAIRLYLFNKWKITPSGSGTISSWGVSPDDPVAFQKFVEFIYTKEIPSEMEKQSVHKVFRQYYEAKIKPEIDKTSAENEKIIADRKKELDESCEPTVFAQFFRVTIGNLLITIGDNFDAAKNESGDISKAIRAVTGISVDSIQEWGLQGGENSEIHKLNSAIDSVMEANGMGSSTVVGQVANSLNPTKWKIEAPKIETPKVDIQLPPIRDIPVIGPILDGIF